MPPISRNRNWRAISVAAIKLTSSAVSSWLLALLDLFPLFTSITCKASVCSIIRYAPFAIETVFPKEVLICLSIPNFSKMGTFD